MQANVFVPFKLIRWIITVVFEVIMFKLTALQFFSRLMYFPGVGWNTIRWRLQKLEWYNRIDNTVVLGALPFRSQAKEVEQYEKVFNLCVFQYIIRYPVFLSSSN